MSANPCGKRCYDNERRAKEANRTGGFRVRAYFCRDCRAFHVTNGEKSRGGMMRGRSWGKGRRG